MAKIERTYNTAKIVESHVEEILNRVYPYANKDKTIFVTPYVNGREKGFMFSLRHIHWKANMVFIAEHRSSDNIALTFSENVYGWEDVTEKDWENSEHFDYNKHYQAAERVCELLFGCGKKYGSRIKSVVSV